MNYEKITNYVIGMISIYSIIMLVFNNLDTFNQLLFNDITSDLINANINDFLSFEYLGIVIKYLGRIILYFVYFI